MTQLGLCLPKTSQQIPGYFRLHVVLQAHSQSKHGKGIKGFPFFKALEQRSVSRGKGETVCFDSLCGETRGPYSLHTQVMIPASSVLK